MKLPVVGFSIPIYDRFDHLQVILSGLRVQTNPSWIAVVVKDGPYSFDERQRMEDFMALDSRIHFMNTDIRTNNWGHSPRQMGKQWLSDNRSQYVIMSGDDNYYTPNLVEELSRASFSNPGLIYWDMVHSHYDYQYFQCRLAFNQIDIGAFALRSDIAHTLELPHSYAADGELVEMYKAQYPREPNIKIDRVLYVHN